MEFPERALHPKNHPILARKPGEFAGAFLGSPGRPPIAL